MTPHLVVAHAAPHPGVVHLHVALEPVPASRQAEAAVSQRGPAVRLRAPAPGPATAATLGRGRVLLGTAASSI